jgi:hypothetical protein
MGVNLLMMGWLRIRFRCSIVYVWLSLGFVLDFGFEFVYSSFLFCIVTRLPCLYLSNSSENTQPIYSSLFRSSEYVRVDY